jgi:hypothetical protein
MMCPATSSSSRNNEHVAQMEFYRKAVCIIFFQGNVLDSMKTVMILIGLLFSEVLETDLLLRDFAVSAVH